MKPHIILFDKQVITRLGMESVILKNPYGQNSTVAVVNSKADLVRTLTGNPDSLIVIDYALSDLNSVDTLLNISARFPNAHWILFSEELSVRFLKKVLCHEAFSVLLKHAGFPEITKAISLAFDKQAFVCAQVKELLAMAEDVQGGNELLTITETEILREIALGKSAREIAALRNVSIHTVLTHRKNIYRKLEVNNSQEATGYALRAGIVSFGYSI